MIFIVHCNGTGQHALIGMAGFAASSSIAYSEANNLFEPEPAQSFADRQLISDLIRGLYYCIRNRSGCSEKFTRMNVNTHM